MKKLSDPITLLRIEGFAIFFLSLALYWQQGYSWTIFWIFILVPDVAFLAYLANANVGAAAYNLTHSKILPSLLCVYGLLVKDELAITLSIIWFTHIGIDRGFGYGLKYSKGFKFTHLGVLGKTAEDHEAR